ncbi:hypothetical protein EW145_g4778 [Phellinidium pouzarii]|uniref:Uncharacterized protein n=1 Tax=Phellinidium pouzarii TaxID=167371 RepID=A0A4V3XCE4_9AGAM|nr:hypothetical protein EW145_g4778 [Phellinidium pouzarii]
MPGPERQVKHKAASDARRKGYPYSRSVRFSDAATVIPCPSTPMKQLTVATEYAESIKLRRKQNVSAAQKHYDNLSARAGRAGSIADAIMDNAGSFALGGAYHPPSMSASMHMLPSAPLPKGPTTQPSVTELENKISQLEKNFAESLGEQINRNDRLERENAELQAKMKSQVKKYEIVLAMMRKATAKNRSSVSKANLDSKVEVQDAMQCDADDERESLPITPSTNPSRPQVSSKDTVTISSFSPSPSASSASSDEELCTPTTTPNMPMREIDDNYDEGYDLSAACLAKTRAEVSLKYGFNKNMNLEETIDQMAEALAVHWKLKDDEDTPTVLASPQTNVVFPQLVVPSIPQFQI